MKTETLKQAIEYVLGEENVKNQIAALEAQPNFFVIHQIAAEVRDIPTSTIRVYINFYEVANPNNASKEDLVVDLQGTTYSNFRITGMSQTQI